MQRSCLESLHGAERLQVECGQTRRFGSAVRVLRRIEMCRQIPVVFVHRNRVNAEKRCEPRQPTARTDELPGASNDLCLKSQVGFWIQRRPQGGDARNSVELVVSMLIHAPCR